MDRQALVRDNRSDNPFRKGYTAAPQLLAFVHSLVICPLFHCLCGRFVNTYTPRKNLGHFKSPAGSYNAQYEAILKKAKGVFDGIISSGATRSEAWLFYDSVYRLEVEYALPQSFFRQKQLSNIEKKTLPWLYARCGFKRNTSRAIVQGPAELGGCGFTPLPTVARFGYIAHFLKFFCSPQEDVGKLFSDDVGVDSIPIQSLLCHPTTSMDSPHLC